MGVSSRNKFQRGLRRSVKTPLWIYSHSSCTQNPKITSSIHLEQKYKATSTWAWYQQCHSVWLARISNYLTFGIHSSFFPAHLPSLHFMWSNGVNRACTVLPLSHPASSSMVKNSPQTDLTVLLLSSLHREKLNAMCTLINHFSFNPT